MPDPAWAFAMRVTAGSVTALLPDGEVSKRKFHDVLPCDAGARHDTRALTKCQMEFWDVFPADGTPCLPAAVRRRKLHRLPVCPKEGWRPVSGEHPSPVGRGRPSMVATPSPASAIEASSALVASKLGG